MTSGVIPPPIEGRYRVATLVKTYGLDAWWGMPRASEINGASIREFARNGAATRVSQRRSRSLISFHFQPWITTWSDGWMP